MSQEIGLYRYMDIQTLRIYDIVQRSIPQLISTAIIKEVLPGNYIMFMQVT